MDDKPSSISEATHGYPYVATAMELLEDNISKIGVTGQIRSRMRSHRSSSSSPYGLFCFQCFRFGSLRDARRAETWVKRELRKLGLSYREHSTEFFQIEPNRICDAVRESIEVLGLSAIDEFPHDFNGILEKSGDFISMPIELLECLTENEAQAYWRGARDVLWTFLRLGESHLLSEDLHALYKALQINAVHRAPMLCETVALHFLNHTSKSQREAGRRLIDEMKERGENGFSYLPGDFLISPWRSKKHS